MPEDLVTFVVVFVQPAVVTLGQALQHFVYLCGYLRYWNVVLWILLASQVLIPQRWTLESGKPVQRAAQ